ncbi:MAG: hypothetical protein HY810_06685 [Candidatus Omnitrophica bacterium]|nr:hypothetical protein [Candidatus Omnitrophota bacterium]
MPQKTHVNITLDNSIVHWIDILRGQQPRSAFINKMLAKYCDKAQEQFNWEEEGRQAEEDIKKGKVKKFSDHKKAVKWLKS